MNSSDNTIDSKCLVNMLFVAVCMVAILVTPPVWSVSKIGIQAIFNYFKQDTFYYLAIAAKSRAGFYTFDGELATTGFHPLWQIYVTGLFNLFPDMTQESQIFSVFFSSVALVTVGFLLTGFALYSITRSKAQAILLVPGLFYSVFSFVTPFSNSPWAFMNGMESGLTVFLGGVLFVLIARFHNEPVTCTLDRRFVIGLGCVLALLVMARLDDVFLLPGFAVSILLLDTRSFPARISNTAMLVFPCAVVLTCYLIFNQYSTGSFMPISGMAKGGLVLLSNIRQLLVLGSLKPFPLSMNAYVQFFEILYRHVQMLFPMLLSVLFLLVIHKGGEDFVRIRDRGMLLTAILLYVFFKGMYNLVNVHVNFQGLSWYYPLSIMSVNFVALLLLWPLFQSHGPWNPMIRVCATVVLALFLTMQVITATATTMNVRTHGNRIFAFWRGAQAIASKLRSKHPGVKLVEFDDGFISYSTGIPAIHGIGFVLDTKGFKAKKQGRFLDYCYKRGFDTIASLQYIPLRKPDLSSPEIARLFKRSRFFGKEDLNKYLFEILLLDGRTGASFVRFMPKSW